MSTSYKEKDTILNNRYHLIKRIGSGVDGVVFKARDNNNGNEMVAIKIERVSERSVNAIDAMKSISHPGIIQLKHVVVIGNECLQVFPLLETKQTINPRDIKPIITNLLEILVELEVQRLIHDDIKPDNILWTSDHKPVLCDFGLAQRLFDTHINLGPWSGQTASFRAPESWHHQPVSSTVDVFGVACCIYYYIANKNIFAPIWSSLMEIDKNEGRRDDNTNLKIKYLMMVVFPMVAALQVDNDVKTLLYKMLELDPSKRKKASTLLEEWTNQSFVFDNTDLPSLRYPYPSARILAPSYRKQFVERAREMMTSSWLTERDMKIRIIRAIHFLDRLRPTHDNSVDLMNVLDFLFEFSKEIVDSLTCVRASALIYSNDNDFKGIYHSLTLFDIDPEVNFDLDLYYQKVVNGSINEIQFDDLEEVFQL